MKIVIFAPHPDDEIAGCGSMLKWRDEGHDIEIIIVSVGRAAYTYERQMGRLIESEATDITEDELVKIRMKEVEDVFNFLEIPLEKVHRFMLPDQNLKNFIKEGIEKSKPIIKDADRIVLPSNNNTHEDHQATYDIAVGAAKELNLTDMEFYGYAIYVANKAPREKMVKIKITEYRDKIFQAISMYKSQLAITIVRTFYDTIKRKLDVVSNGRTLRR